MFVQGDTRSWTKDLSICSRMLYHWAISPLREREMEFFSFKTTITWQNTRRHILSPWIRYLYWVSNIKYSNSITTLNGYHWMWIMQAIHQQVIFAFLVGYKHFEIAVVKWEIRLKCWFSREPFLLVSIPCFFFCFHFCPLSEWSYDWLFFFLCDSLLAFRFLHPPTPFDSSDEILALNNDKIIEIRNIPDLHQLVYSDQIEPILKYHLQPWERWL